MASATAERDPSRPQPREEPAAEAPQCPDRRVVLAAGLSSRMGSKQLLADIEGKRWCGV